MVNRDIDSVRFFSVCCSWFGRELLYCVVNGYFSCRVLEGLVVLFGRNLVFFRF